MKPWGFNKRVKRTWQNFSKYEDENRERLKITICFGWSPREIRRSGPENSYPLRNLDYECQQKYKMKIHPESKVEISIDIHSIRNFQTLAMGDWWVEAIIYPSFVFWKTQELITLEFWNTIEDAVKRRRSKKRSFRYLWE